jgi:hypothetical protein
VIKAMNHPPMGVFFCCSGDLRDPGRRRERHAERRRGIEAVWAARRRAMNDPFFQATLVTVATDSLSARALQSLRAIVADENFQPAAIGRASSAEKTICQFVAALAPYCDALEFHKEDAKRTSRR